MGYGSTYEQDLLLEIERGVLVATHVNHNGTTESGRVGAGYQVGAMTVFPTDRTEEGNVS